MTSPAIRLVYAPIAHVLRVRAHLQSHGRLGFLSENRAVRCAERKDESNSARGRGW